MYVFLFAGCPGEFGNGESEKSLSHPAISAHQWVDNPVVSWSLYFSGFSPRSRRRGLAPIFITVFRRLRKKERQENIISGAESETIAEKDVIPPHPNVVSLFGRRIKESMLRLSRTQPRALAVVTLDGDWRILNNVQI